MAARRTEEGEEGVGVRGKVGGARVLFRGGRSGRGGQAGGGGGGDDGREADPGGGPAGPVGAAAHGAGVVRAGVGLRHGSEAERVHAAADGPHNGRLATGVRGLERGTVVRPVPPPLCAVLPLPHGALATGPPQRRRGGRVGRFARGVHAAVQQRGREVWRRPGGVKKKPKG